jgi:hypothetical protein
LLLQGHRCEIKTKVTSVASKASQQGSGKDDLAMNVATFRGYALALRGQVHADLLFGWETY